MDPPAVGAQHLDAQAVDLHVFAALGQTAQMVDHQAAHGIEFLVAEMRVEGRIEIVNFGGRLDAVVPGMVEQAKARAGALIEALLPLAEAGVAIMRVTESLDEGPVCLMERVAIEPETTAGELHDALSELGAELMVEALTALGQGSLHCVAQDSNAATYAEKLRNEETRIDWTRPAQEIQDHIRGLSPFPGAWFEMDVGGDEGKESKPERIKVQGSTRADGRGAPGTVLDEHLTVACGNGAVRLTRVQRAGKKPMLADAFLRGVHLPPGSRLT